MSESSNKQMKLLNELPPELTTHVLSFLPIQSVLQVRVLSKEVRRTEIRSFDLDFSRLSPKRHTQLEAATIIQSILNQHQGDEIKRFVVCLNHFEVEDKIISWIQTCIDKKIEELELDFSPSKEILEIPIDFTAIKTLTVLKLRWCKFEILNDSPTGMKHLRTLSLMRTDVTKPMLNAIFNNCMDLESLEVIQCQAQMDGILCINADKNKKFKRLVVSSMLQLWKIIVNAPTLEYYEYDGYVKSVSFSGRVALKDAKLHYNRNSMRYYDPSHIVIANMSAFTRVTVFSTTNILLEALTHRYVEGTIKKPIFDFVNLTEFHILFKAPSVCNAYDIAEFLKDCPKLEKVFIDINNFTFEHDMFWLTLHKDQIHNENYYLKCLKEVNVFGYKGHWHEIDLMDFFVRKAPFLMKLNLMSPKNPKMKIHEPDNARLNYIRSIAPRKCLIEFKEV